MFDGKEKTCSVSHCHDTSLCFTVSYMLLCFCAFNTLRHIKGTVAVDSCYYSDTKYKKLYAAISLQVI